MFLGINGLWALRFLVNNMNKLGQCLINKELLSQEQLDFALEIQRKVKGKKLGAILNYYNFVSDIDVTKIVAEQVGWEYFNGNYIHDTDIVALFGINWLSEKLMYPIKNGKDITFIVADSEDTQATDYVRSLLNEKVSFKNGRLIDFKIGGETSLRRAMEELIDFCNKKAFGIKCINEEEDYDLSKWFDQMLKDAVSQSVTDIHCEPSENALEIRFRIDGILHFYSCLETKYINRFANIVFARSNKNIGEFRQFHDFRFDYSYLNRNIDIRVSHIPSTKGSSLVLRLLDKSKSAIPITSLGYSKEQWEIIKKAIRRPQGIILLCGTTGCGKTTTLFSMLNENKSLGHKTISIEDPVEYETSLMTQVSVKKEQNIDFNSSIRAFLRQDPDVILLGEIRDDDSAKLAIRASITGHKVFSTIHTNSACGAILRLKDLGIELSFIADSLTCIISQRLVRKLCKYCKEEIFVTKDALDEDTKRLINRDHMSIYKAVGCKHCHSGYRGRTVIAEILYVDDYISQLIVENRVNDIFSMFKSKQIKSIYDDGARLIEEGATSLEEIIRVLG